MAFNADPPRAVLDWLADLRSAALFAIEDENVCQFHMNINTHFVPSGGTPEGF